MIHDCKWIAISSFNIKSRATSDPAFNEDKGENI
jgi:hypothetical protein